MPRCLPPPPCYRAARRCSRSRNAGKLPLLRLLPLPVRCCRVSCPGAATNDAALPPHCQAGRRSCAAAATTAAALLLFPFCCAARRRHPAAAVLSPPPCCYRCLCITTTIVVLPPPPLCCRCLHRRAATTAKVTALMPPLPLHFCLRCRQAAAELPPLPPPLLQMSSAVGVEGAHLHVRVYQPNYLLMHQLCVTEWMIKNTVLVSCFRMYS